MKTNRTTKKPSVASSLKKIEEAHPYKMILFLGMVGSSMIFLYTVLAYSATHAALEASEFNIPKAFIVGSFILVFSSFTITPSLPGYQKEDINRLKKSLHVTLVLGVAFMVCQVVGWKEMLALEEAMGSDSAPTYLYILSALHGVHFIAGITFLAWLTHQWSRWINDPVKVLIAITNPFEKLKLEMLNIYWHFLDVVWILLFLFFLFFIY